jgi:purine-nucleoside/S-methyl-5'-thioadenosine phosphorylase / adenosine deaminase
MMVNKNGLLFFQFSHLSAHSNIQHGIFTRKGGQSQEPYDGLNVCTTVGDNPDHVKQNRQAISKCMEATDLVFINQVHGVSVKVLQKGKQGSYTKKQNGDWVGDALITNAPHTYLTIQVADCQPVLLVDPIKRVIANVHSGWRGNIQNIIGKTVQKMVDIFSCRPQDLLAGIGPSLGPCCAEFVNYQNEIPEPLWQYKNNTDHFDFWAISRSQLLNNGLIEKNIQTSKLCTRCRSDLFFSYRENKVTGRFASVIGLTS